jgi:hypothetical protein
MSIAPRTRSAATVAVLLALCCPAAALAATATTAPTRAVLVKVTISDKGINTALYNSDKAPNAAESYFVAYYAMRGQMAYFVIHNQGKRKHNFTVLGRKTKAIPPGKTARFHLVLKQRGKFPYRSTLDKGKQFSGVLAVA